MRGSAGGIAGHGGCTIWLREVAPSSHISCIVVYWPHQHLSLAWLSLSASSALPEAGSLRAKQQQTEIVHWAP